jgi:hypothetical protein
VFLQAYGTAVLIIAGSLVLGTAICAGAARDARWWAAPAVGLASLIVLAGAVIKLPGHAVTADVVCLLVVGVSAAVLLKLRVSPIALGDVPLAGAALLVASLPFIASGRVGLPGVSLDNDTDLHLLLAEGVRSPAIAKLWGPQNGYPLGPHSLVAATGTAINAPLDMVFTGLLLAVVPITALVAAGALARQAYWRRFVVGILCSIPYLVAAYYAEGAFKETIMASLLLAFVIHLEQAQSRWASAGTAARWWLVAPAVLLGAGAFYTYSYIGLVWYAVTLAIWAIAESVRKPALVRNWLSRRKLVIEARWIAGALVLAAVAILPVAGQTVSFFHSVGVSASGTGAIPATALGNLVGRLSPYEMLNIWTSPDFRRLPMDVFHAGQLSAFALAVVAFGVLWSLRRTKLLLPAAALACVAIWWRADRTQSPYVSAKALVIAAPLLMALGLRALLTPRRGVLSVGALRLTVAALFCAFAAYSSYQVLRNEPVQAPAAGRDLAAFHRNIGSSSVLFLGDDDYSPWQLRPAAVSALAANTPALGGASTRPGKPWVYGAELDFDSVLPSDLEKFPYVITSNTPYASQRPSNFRLLASTPLYELWERIGSTTPRSVLEPSGAPGAILDCRSPLGRKLRHEHGIASVMPTPVTVPGPGFPAGAGAATSLPLPLPEGKWEISIQYVSSFDVRLRVEGERWTMPAYLGRPGPFFAVGSVTGHGRASPVIVTMASDKPSFLTGTGDNLFTSIPTIAATRIPDTRQIVPLGQACGKYVDWYRLLPLR